MNKHHCIRMFIFEVLLSHPHTSVTVITTLGVFRISFGLFLGKEPFSINRDGVDLAIS